jgi:nucleoside-diphosphate-sugar epimerase
LKSIDDIKSFLGSKSAPFDVIIDNHSKDTETVKTFLDDSPSAQYCYISSGGMYKGKCPPNGHVEATCEVKPDNECRIIEQFLIDSGKIYTSFRPQYIYGDNTNKRGNLDWFFDRLAKTSTKSEVTIPIPGDGSQKVALTHVDDVSSMIVSAIGNEKAYKQIFNCGTDSFIGYSELCESIAKLAGGKKMKYVSYDPKKLETKPSFPYRPSTFTLDPSKAKSVLGWSGPKNSINSDLGKWYAQYKSLGLADKAFDDAEDKSIISSV